MKALIPLTLLFATPAVAHPANMAHSHGADWAVPLGLALIVLAAMGARKIRVRK